MNMSFMTPLLKKNQKTLKKMSRQQVSFSPTLLVKITGSYERCSCCRPAPKFATALSSQTKTTAFISAFRRLQLSQIDKILERQVLAGDLTFTSLTQMQGNQTRDTNEYTNTCTCMLLLVCTSMWVTMKVHMHISCRAGGRIFLE